MTSIDFVICSIILSYENVKFFKLVYEDLKDLFKVSSHISILFIAKVNSEAWNCFYSPKRVIFTYENMVALELYRGHALRPYEFACVMFIFTSANNREQEIEENNAKLLLLRFFQWINKFHNFSSCIFLKLLHLLYLYEVKRVKRLMNITNSEIIRSTHRLY